MKTKSFVGTHLPCAWIVNPNDKGRKSIKNGKVYLDSGQEFAIEIFNPLSDSVRADIKVNNRVVSEGGLVIRPGQRFYLDCFISDRRKFIFNTYEVENTIESLKAIEENGIVEISFFKERKYTNNWFTPQFPNYRSGGTDGTVTWTIGGDIATYTMQSMPNDFMGAYSVNCSNVETGRVEGGSMSSQSFTDINMDFEYSCISTIRYQILPSSRKPLEVNDLRKKFCSECGRKLKDSFKFCPDCGTEM